MHVWRFLFGLLALLCATTAFAHGGGKPHLLNQPLDETLIFSVWTDPVPARVGEVHLSMALAEARTQAPVLDRVLTLQIVDRSGTHRPILRQAELGRTNSQLFYEADIDFPADGMWDVQISVLGVDDVAQFSLEIRPERSPFIYMLGVLPVILLIYFYRKRGQS